MNIMRMVRPYIGKHRLEFLSFFFIGIFVWILSMIVPYLTGSFIDSLLNKNNHNIIYFYTGILLVIMFMDTVMKYRCNVFLLHLQNKISFDMNLDIVEHIKRLPISFFKSINSTYLSQRINVDCNTVISFAINNSFNLVVNTLTFLGATLILFVINIKLAFVLIILLPIYIKVYSVFKQPLYKMGYELKENQSLFFSFMNDQFANMKLIKVNALFNLVGKQLSNRFIGLYNNSLKYGKASFKFSTCDKVIGDIASVILFFIGGYQILNNVITVGQYMMLSGYFSMLLKCTSFYMQLGKSYQDTLISYERLEEIKNTKNEQNGEKRLSSIETIELKNLNFSYDENKKLINDFNHKFTKGNIYCIVGENGTGKSTLINIIIGLYNGYYQGSILYNSINLKELDTYHLRYDLIGVSEQEPTLFNDTLLNNLTYGIQVKSMEKIMDWCTKLDLDNFIKSSDKGLGMNIFEKTCNISGGEKQKISLIRLFLKDPDILILDEPTSALDQISLDKFSAVIEEVKENKIIFIITHNEKLISISDYIINSKDLSSNIKKYIE